MSDLNLDSYREKWREVPRGSDVDGRRYSTDLLRLSDEALLAAWEEMAERRYHGEHGWLGPLYADTFRGRKIVELGSGLGFDGLRFAAWGASWTFADIVPENLELVGRVTRLKGLQGKVSFHLIGDDLSFEPLPHDYDAVWVFGSIHHVPFEIARREALDVLGHLKPGGRWMELVYPRERWLREGALAFDQWGKLTDGERTPWAEWHDVEKVRRRLSPAPFRVLLDFEFCSNNYRWLDLQFSSDTPFSRAGLEDASPVAGVDLKRQPILLAPGARRRGLSAGAWSFVSPSGLFAPVASVELAAATAAKTIDLEISVDRGAVGVGLLTRAMTYTPGGEAIVDQGRNTRLVTLRGDTGEAPARLVFRNLDARSRSRFTVHSAISREAN